MVDQVGPAPSTGQVFLSYSRTDATYVVALTAHLERAGIPVWTDAKIRNEDWIDVVRRQIEECAAFVAVMTPEAEQSPEVRREIARAEQVGRPIFPLLLAGKPVFQLGSMNYFDVTGGRLPGPDWIEQLRACVAQRITVPARVRPAAKAPRPRRRVARIVLRTLAVLLTLAVLAGAGTAYALVWRQLWLGFDGEQVAIFRGPVGEKVLVAEASAIVRTQVPVSFREVLSDGIPVDDVADGLRLAGLLPALYDQPDVAEGYEDDGGTLIPVGSCMAEACGGPHHQQLYAAVLAPFHRYPGSPVMEVFAHDACQQRLTRLAPKLGAVTGVGSGFMQGEYPFVTVLWRGSTWSDGAHTVGCVLLPGVGWTMYGSFPDGSMNYQGAEAEVSTNQANTFNTDTIALPYRKANSYLGGSVTLSSSGGLRFGLACRVGPQRRSLYAIIVSSTGHYSISKRADDLWWPDLAKGDLTLRTNGQHSVSMLCNTSEDGKTVEIAGSVDGTEVSGIDPADPLLDGDLALYMANSNDPPNGAATFRTIYGRIAGGRAVYPGA